MKKNLYQLLILTIISFNLAGSLFGFNYKVYDPDRPINKKFIPTLKEIESPSYLNNIIIKLNKEIEKNPKNFDLYRIKLDYVYLLWEVSPKKEIYNILRRGSSTVKQMCKYFPEHPHCPFSKALMLSLLGLEKGPLNVLQGVPKVIKLYKESIKKDPTWFYSFAIRNLGRLYFKLPPFPISVGNINTAKKYLYIAYRNNPDHPDIYVYLADLYYLTGKKPVAISFLKKLYDLKPATWMEKIILTWTKRTIPTIIKKYNTGTYDKYNWDYLLDPSRHPDKK